MQATRQTLVKQNVWFPWIPLCVNSSNASDSLMGILSKDPYRQRILLYCFSLRAFGVTRDTLVRIDSHFPKKLKCFLMVKSSWSLLAASAILTVAMK